MPPAAAHAALTEAFAPTLQMTDDARFDLVGVGASDAAVLAGAGVADRLRRMLDGSVAQGVEGMVADIAGYSLRPWGFDPADVSQAVLLGYGASDGRVGAEHGHWYRRALRDARLQIVPAAGHLVVVTLWEQVLGHLVGPSESPGRN